MLSCVDQTEHRSVDIKKEGNISANVPLKRRKLLSQDMKNVVEKGLCDACRKVFDEWNSCDCGLKRDSTYHSTAWSVARYGQVVCGAEPSLDYACSRSLGKERL